MPVACPTAFARVAEGLAGELAAALEGVDVVIAHNVASLGRNLALTAALHERATRPGAPRTILWHHDLAGRSPATVERCTTASRGTSFEPRGQASPRSRSPRRAAPTS